MPFRRESFTQDQAEPDRQCVLQLQSPVSRPFCTALFIHSAMSCIPCSVWSYNLEWRKGAKLPSKTENVDQYARQAAETKGKTRTTSSSRISCSSQGQDRQPAVRCARGLAEGGTEPFQAAAPLSTPEVKVNTLPDFYFLSHTQVKQNNNNRSVDANLLYAAIK